MPEITVTHIALLAVAAIAGVVAGWIVRGQRAAQEKTAISAGWQDQVDAQRKEHDRLVDQNKGLMEQISQYQASNKDAKNRARELAAAVQEAYERRDTLQREIKDIRANLESAVTARERLKSDIASLDAERDQMRAKDEKIARLARELENWQSRVPPLIERFRQRNEEATRLEAELNTARQRIRELEFAQAAGQTRIESVNDPDELTDGREASNDPQERGDEALPAGAAWDDIGDASEIDEAADGADKSDEMRADSEAAPNVLVARDDDDAMPNRLRDDLKMIKGIGPAIEKTLNELGIFRFQQIADMSEYDIDRVANRLKGFRSRIYREDWIGQARMLRDQLAGRA